MGSDNREPMLPGEVEGRTGLEPALPRNYFRLPEEFVVTNDHWDQESKRQVMLWDFGPSPTHYTPEAPCPS